MNDTKRCIITVTGIVQGVGFRPFVYRTAKRFHLNGWVENEGSRVCIDAEGSEAAIRAFITDLRDSHPPNAQVAALQIFTEPLCGYRDFTIKSSALENKTASFLSPDLAVCQNCMREFRTLGNKRFLYPFISCTDCGPRYSIIDSLPYDRKNTSMRKFEMCPQCTAEYESPNDRRFHAQTNCCTPCGPVVQLFDSQGKAVPTDDPIGTARNYIGASKILAVKGIGGYHLCCNAHDTTAIQTLRKRKRRPEKPFAIMSRNQNAVHELCEVSATEQKILTGCRKPILLLDKKMPEYLPAEIAPNQKRLGIMLPYAPLHFLLFPDNVNHLVMTSGNVSGSPIHFTESSAFHELQNVADYFLVHNRDIIVPVDDAVVKVVNDCEVLVRCGRGYAPLTLPLQTAQPLLALGAEQKSSVCIAGNGFSAVSQYLGDLNNYQACQLFERQIKHFKRLFDFQPAVFAHDLNPDSLSARYAKEQNGQKIAIQHHHAHMAGCMAENGLTQNVIGVIYDGTGLGTDGTVWGGEFLIGGLTGFSRAGHLQSVLLQGGDSAVREPWRCAASYLYALNIDPQIYLPDIDKDALRAIHAAIQKGIQCFQSTSMGRLFDCVSALCGFQRPITFDAQAAIALENLVDDNTFHCYACPIHSMHGILTISYDEILKGVLNNLQQHIPRSVIAAKFHNTLVEATVRCVSALHHATGLRDVVLSGGVFENTYLLKRLIKVLENNHFHVYFNRLTPANDGGIAFGQAAAAGAITKENSNVSCSSGKNHSHT